ncbi:MAG: HAD-IIIC family phosphatase [Acidobacteriota bacterium]
MNDSKLRCLLIADFTINTFAGYLANEAEAPALSCQIAPFDQVTPVLLDADHEVWRQQWQSAVVWTLPQKVSRTFQRRLQFEPSPAEEALAEVEQFCAQLQQAAMRVPRLFVPTWTLPWQYRNFGPLDLTPEMGVTHLLWQMNLRLADKLAATPNIHLLATHRWLQMAGKNGFNPALWYTAKVAFGNEVLQEAARDLKAALRGCAGQARKLLVLDLDDTLWGGVVGEQGWENLRLGGHDFRGEAFVDFQRALKALKQSGILLALVSKNEESVALAAIRQHPEMVLREADFAAWRINWYDKARNIADLVQELNLGLQSVVFIDDHPVERERVRTALPEVLVPEWPEDPMRYVGALHSLTCFDRVTLTREDGLRNEMYAAERERGALKQSLASLDEWLASLATRITVSPLTTANLARASQLLNKTNQMNLSTRRLTETELQSWARADGHWLRVVSISDKFGDAGLTGIVSWQRYGDGARLVDFVLSCRVMGRQIEETMLALALAEARAQDLTFLEASYLSTEKNKPCLTFFGRLGWERSEDVFRLPLTPHTIPFFPDHIILETSANA